MADKVSEIKLKICQSQIKYFTSILSERGYLVPYFDSMNKNYNRIFIAVAR